MKVRLIIENRGWKYRLHVNEGPVPERYYLTLRGLKGERLEHPPAIGPFPSLDLIRQNAVTFYLQLERMLEPVIAHGAGVCTSAESAPSSSG